MPRFYFHLYNDDVVLDETGKELPDLEAARAHALAMAGFEIAESAKRDGQIVLSHWIDIAGEDGAVLAQLRFRDAVRIAS